jgi:hypothetical protein
MRVLDVAKGKYHPFIHQLLTEYGALHITNIRTDDMPFRAILQQMGFDHVHTPLVNQPCLPTHHFFNDHLFNDPHHESHIVAFQKTKSQTQRILVHSCHMAHEILSQSTLGRGLVDKIRHHGYRKRNSDTNLINDWFRPLWNRSEKQSENQRENHRQISSLPCKGFVDGHVLFPHLDRESHSLQNFTLGDGSIFTVEEIELWIQVALYTAQGWEGRVGDIILLDNLHFAFSNLPNDRTIQPSNHPTNTLDKD